VGRSQNEEQPEKFRRFSFDSFFLDLITFVPNQRIGG
jgi:hypothetical protein